VNLLPPRSIKNVSVPERFLAYLGSDQPKMTDSFPPHRWADPTVMEPLRDEDAVRAVALAVHLFDFGRERETRLRFARELTCQPAMRERWFRSLALEIKR
jgi:hypothetical protein